MSNKTKGKIQRWGPIVISFAGSVVAIIAYCNFEIKGDFSQILQSAIVFASIITGFLGVMIGILFSLSEKESMKVFMKTTGYDALIDYFMKSVRAAILLVFVSMLLFLRESCLHVVFCGALVVWTFLLLYTLTGAYRVIKIIFYIAFTNKGSEYKKPEGRKMGEDEKERLKAELPRRS